MWFRGVTASMGLCFDFGAVLEAHPDVILDVDGDVVHHRQPVCFPELRHCQFWGFDKKRTFSKLVKEKTNLTEVQLEDFDDLMENIYKVAYIDGIKDILHYYDLRL